MHYSKLYSKIGKIKTERDLNVCAKCIKKFLESDVNTSGNKSTKNTFNIIIRKEY